MGLLILFHPFHLRPYLSHSVSSSLTFHFPSARMSFTRWKSKIRKKKKKMKRVVSFLMQANKTKEEKNDTEEKVGATKAAGKSAGCGVPASLAWRAGRKPENYGRAAADTCSTPHIRLSTCVDVCVFPSACVSAETHMRLMHIEHCIASLGQVVIGCS